MKVLNFPCFVRSANLFFNGWQLEYGRAPGQFEAFSLLPGIRWLSGYHGSVVEYCAVQARCPWLDSRPFHFPLFFCLKNLLGAEVAGNTCSPAPTKISVTLYSNSSAEVSLQQLCVKSTRTAFSQVHLKNWKKGSSIHFSHMHLE